MCKQVLILSPAHRSSATLIKSYKSPLTQSYSDKLKLPCEGDDTEPTFAVILMSTPISKRRTAYATRPALVIKRNAHERPVGFSTSRTTSEVGMELIQEWDEYDCSQVYAKTSDSEWTKLRKIALLSCDLHKTRNKFYFTTRLRGKITIKRIRGWLGISSGHNRQGLIGIIPTRITMTQAAIYPL